MLHITKISIHLAKKIYIKIPLRMRKRSSEQQERDAVDTNPDEVTKTEEMVVAEKAFVI